MEGQQHHRRSPSVGRQANTHISQPSSSKYPDHVSGIGLDPSITASTFTAGAFNTGIPTTNAGDQYDFSKIYLNVNSQPPRFQQNILPSNDFSAQELDQSYGQGNNISNGQQRPSQLHLPDSNRQFTNEFTPPEPSSDFGGGQLQPQGLNGKQESSFDNFMVDPSLQSGGQGQNHSINPADLMESMSSTQGLLPTPPNVMMLDSRNLSGQSPSMQQTQFYTPGHSRHTSLDPARQNFGNLSQHTDWTGMLGGASFQQHRRAPSEHSEIGSVAPSPYLGQQESFDGYDQDHSPMMNPQQDNSLYHEALKIERFSLSDHQHQQQRQGLSPRPSPYVSPRMAPHQGLGIQPDSQFILPSNDMNAQFGNGPGPTFSNYELKHDSSDMGQAAQMAPPEINVELAPPSRLSQFEPTRDETDLDTLSPPDRGKYQSAIQPGEIILTFGQDEEDA